MKIWLNNRLVPEKKAVVSVFDRGFLYGDGVYETMRVYNGVTFRIKDHLSRLRVSAKGIKMPLPWTNVSLVDAINKVIQVNRLKNATVRLEISRGPGNIGYDPPKPFRPTLVIIGRVFEGYPERFYRYGVKVAVVNIKRNDIMCLNPGVKSSNCLNGILAKFEAIGRGAFEGIFLNLRGRLAEGTVSNVFIVKGGRLFTPPLSAGILSGVTRSVVMELAASLEVSVSEVNLLPERLFNADEAFLASTNMEIMPIVRVDAGSTVTKIGSGAPGPVTRALINEFRKLNERY